MSLTSFIISEDILFNAESNEVVSLMVAEDSCNSVLKCLSVHINP